MRLYKYLNLRGKYPGNLNMSIKQLCITVLLLFSGFNIPVFAQDNWVFGNPVQPAYNYNPSDRTIQYYPPELGSGSRMKYYKTAPTFYAVPGRIEPNVQPNPLKDEMEKTDYV